MKIIDRKIRERFFLTYSELAKLSFESSLIDASDDLRFIVSDLLDIDITPIARVDAVATAGSITFELDCNTTEFQDRVQDADLDDKAFKQAYWHIWRGAEILASGDCLLYKSTATQGQSPLPAPIDEYATIDYVDAQDAETLQDAKDYADEKVGQFQNLFFYMVGSTSATAGSVAFNIKPSGDGTLIPAWGGALTTVSRQVYGFQYTTQNLFTLTPNSPFTVVVPYRNLQTTRSYFARYLVTATHPTLNSGNPITIFDLTRGPTTPNNATYDVEFNIVNNQTSELVLPAGTVLDFKIYAYVATATGTMSILINDNANTMLVARSERVGQTSATSIITTARGISESQENFNEYVYEAIGQTIIDNALLEDRLNGNS